MPFSGGYLGIALDVGANPILTFPRDNCSSNSSIVVGKAVAEDEVEEGVAAVAGVPVEEALVAGSSADKLQGSCLSLWATRGLGMTRASSRFLEEDLSRSSSPESVSSRFSLEVVLTSSGPEMTVGASTSYKQFSLRGFGRRPRFAPRTNDMKPSRFHRLKSFQICNKLPRTYELVCR